MLKKLFNSFVEKKEPVVSVPVNRCVVDGISHVHYQRMLKKEADKVIVGNNPFYCNKKSR